MSAIIERMGTLDDNDVVQSIEDVDDAKEVLTSFLLGVMNNQKLKESCSGTMVQIKAAELLGSVWNVYQSDCI